MIPTQVAVRVGRPVLAGAAALVVLGVLAACQSAPAPSVAASRDPVPTPGLESSAPAAVPDDYAVDWVEHTVPEFVVSGAYYEIFSAGGRFWVYDRGEETTLHSTDDGSTWTTLRLTDVGVPAGARLSVDTNRCGDGSLVRDVPGGVELVYASSYNNSHPLGLDSEYFFVALGSEVPVVRSGTDAGWESMPTAQNGFDFRTSCLAGVHDLGDRRVAVGIGQWWRPYDTGGHHPFVAIEGADGRWEIQPLRDQAASVALSAPIDATVALDDAVLLLSATGEGVVVERSADAAHWERQVLPGLDRAANRVWAVRGAAGAFVIASAYDGPGDHGDECSFYSWSSPDGATWSPAVRLAERADADLRLLAATAHGVYAVVEAMRSPADASTTTVLLRSDDAAELEATELTGMDAIPFLGQVVPLGDGLVSFNTFPWLYSSGLGWAGAPAESAPLTPAG